MSRAARESVAEREVVDYLRSVIWLERCGALDGPSNALRLAVVDASAALKRVIDREASA